jgi:phosphinothricin acetyltransferase
MTAAFAIEPATRDDAAACAAIYADHVLHGTATFETEPPDAEAFAARIGHVTAAGAPWLVARDPAGDVLGYAYAAQFRDRPAYRYAAEDSIYIADECRGRGIGGALLAALIAACTQCGFRQIFAVIGGGEPASIAVHARAGFTHAGRMRAIGRKHGRWLDTVYMQLSLGPGDGEPPPGER